MSLRTDCVVRVVRFEQYPTEQPNSFVVGFTVALHCGKSIYRDTIVPFALTNNKNEQEIVELGWEALKANVEAWYASVCKNSVVGIFHIPESPHETPEELDEAPEELDEAPEELDEAPEELDETPEELDETPEELDETHKNNI